MSFLFEIPEADLSILIETIPNNLQTLIKAMSDHSKKDDFFDQVVPPKFRRPLKEEISYVGEVTALQNQHAKILVLKTMRELQSKNQIPGPAWHLPEQIILTEFPQQKEGMMVLKFEDGIVAAEGLMEKGKRGGPWKHYFDTGKILAEGNYELGAKWGDWIFYYPNGEKKSKGPFYEDSKHGLWLEWDKHGNEKKLHYEMGKLVG